MPDLPIETGRQRARLLGLCLLIFCGILAVFWRVVTYPFIQDDWEALHLAVNHDTISLLKMAFSPGSDFVFRPFGVLYIVLVHRLFGLNPLGHHVFALLVHLCSSLLVVYIVHKITGEGFLSWITGLLYATAVNIHMDPLLWAVGSDDIGGAFFFFSSFALFLKRRPILSALVLLLGILLKESPIFLPGVLFCYLLYRDDQISPKRMIARLWPHAVVLAVFVALKMRGVSPLTLPEDHPYKVKLVGMHLLKNVLLYGRWSLDAILPVKGLRLGTAAQFSWLMARPLLMGGLVLAGAVGFCLVCASIFMRRRDRDNKALFDGLKLTLFWGAWFFMGLALFWFLVNHSYYYYLTYSLPALIVLFLYGLRAVALRLGCKRRHITAIIIALAVISVISSSYHFYRRDRKGINHEFTIGRNHLIKRGYTVKLVMNHLLKAHPFLPRGSVLIFGGIDVWSFYRDCGAQVWYLDNTIRVFGTDALGSAPDGIYVEDSSERQSPLYRGPRYSRRIYLDPRKTFIFALRNGALREYKLSDLHTVQSASLKPSLE